MYNKVKRRKANAWAKARGVKQKKKTRKIEKKPSRGGKASVEWRLEESEIGVSAEVIFRTGRCRHLFFFFAPSK